MRPLFAAVALAAVLPACTSDNGLFMPFFQPDLGAAGDGQFTPDFSLLPTGVDLAVPVPTQDLSAPPDLAVAPTCSDSVKNQGESDVDCGGPCPPCAVGKLCGVPADCASSVCTLGRCAAPSCADHLRNGDETDVDCGGSCPACVDGRGCKVARDCLSQVCSRLVCAAPACNDGVKNGSETDVDCGGTCPACAVGAACSVGKDCSSGVCQGGRCAAPACNDGVQNGSETDVDCGGGTCPACAVGRMCLVGADCATDVCKAGTCSAASCNDNVKNGGETDVDCGGGQCPACADGKLCGQAGDCASKVCKAGTCAAPTCMDGVKNGGETDVDCGGPCAPCAVGKACSVAKDCVAKVCKAGTCAAPSCMDGVQNGVETDVDCGGGMCPACPRADRCKVNADCVSQECIAGRCDVATSCAALLAALPGTASGQWLIDPDGPGGADPYAAYCDMTNDGGGWTLALKVDGAKATFVYAARAWNDNTTFGAADTSLSEAKLLPYSTVPFGELRIVMHDGGADRALHSTVPVPGGATLSSVIAGGLFYATNLGRKAWVGWMASGSLQTHCGQEGINNKVTNQNLRIGIFGNQENDCFTCDSFIGIGYDWVSAGNIAGAQWDDSGAGGRYTLGFASVYVR